MGFWDSDLIDSCNCSEYDCGLYDFYRCGDLDIIVDLMRWLILGIIWYILIVAIISFLITLWFYLIYKRNGEEHPRKHAFKRSWPWRIAVFLIPIVCVWIGFWLVSFL